MKAVKIVVAAITTLLCVASIGMLLMRDASQRPEYCKTCHAVQPYYETWAAGDLLAHQHAVAAVACQSCHPQDLQDTLRENVSNLKAGDSATITPVEWSDEECLSCHGDKATLALATSNLDPNPHASPHVGNVPCRQCHNMHTTSEYACAQCHTTIKAAPGWTTKVTQKLDIKVWSPDTDCAACHSMQPYAASLQDSNLLAHAHAQLGVKCQDCHTDAAALQQAHEKAVPGEPVKRLLVDNKVCLDCHVKSQHTTWDEIIARTKDYVIEGKKVNPHAPHPAGANVEDFKCAACHSMHKPSPLVTGCYSCHHNQDFRPCGECHAQYLKKQ